MMQHIAISEPDLAAKTLDFQCEVLRVATK